MDKKKMQWARTVLLTTTNGIFPGVLEHYKTSQEIESSPNSAMIRRRMAASTVRVHSSLPIQVMLYASSSFFVIYFICVLGTLDTTLNRLKNFHKIILLTLSSLCLVMNITRYALGFSANLKDNAIKMTSYWMLTLTQIPFLLFILLTDLFSPVLQSFSVTMDSVISCLVLAELLISFSHTRRLLMNEITLMKLANESLKIPERPKPESGSGPRSRSASNGSFVHYQGISEPDSEPEYGTKSEDDNDKGLRAPTTAYKVDKIGPKPIESFRKHQATKTNEVDVDRMAEQLKDSFGSETDQEIKKLFKPAEDEKSVSESSDSNISSISELEGSRKQPHDSDIENVEVVASDQPRRHHAHAPTPRASELRLVKDGVEDVYTEPIPDFDDNDWSDYSDSEVDSELDRPDGVDIEESEHLAHGTSAAVHKFSNDPQDIRGGILSASRGDDRHLGPESSDDEDPQDVKPSKDGDLGYKDVKWGQSRR